MAEHGPAPRSRFYTGGRRTRRRACRSLLLGLVLTTLVGCATVPADTEGTTDRVRGGVLRVGLTHNPPWVDATDPAVPRGTEAALVEELATALDAEPEWTTGSEAALVTALHEGRLDLVAGGFTDDTPWSQQVAMTAPYTEERDGSGRTLKHVLLTRAGENRFLTTVERFLAEQEGVR